MLLFQISNIHTGGMQVREVAGLKTEILKGLGDVLPPRDKQCLEKSDALDNVLCDPFIHPLQKTNALLNAFQELKTNEFIILSNGYFGHSTAMLFQKNDQGNLEMAIANRASFSSEYHSRDEMGRMYVKSIVFDPAAISASRADSVEIQYCQREFERILAHGVMEIYARKSGLFQFDEDAFYRIIADMKSPGVVELFKQGRPQVPQKADNCVTTSFWAGLSYLYSQPADKTQYQEYRKIYTQHLKDEIKNLAPNLTDSDIDQILALNTLRNPIAWTKNHAEALMAKGNNENLSTDYRIQKYEQAISEFQKYLANRAQQRGLSRRQQMADQTAYSMKIEFCRKEIENMRTESVLCNVPDDRIRLSNAQG